MMIELVGFVFRRMIQLNRAIERGIERQTGIHPSQTYSTDYISLCVCAQSCSRQLVTVDLNLTNAEFIQFYFMYGCMIPPSNRNQGVLLEYSLNGGINWHLLTEIFYDLYTKPG